MAFEECQAKGLMMVSRLFTYDLMQRVRIMGMKNA